MSQKSEIFDTHYHDYLKKIGRIDQNDILDILGIDAEGGIFRIPFMGTVYQASPQGIFDPGGARPGYATCGLDCFNFTSPWTLADPKA